MHVDVRFEVADRSAGVGGALQSPVADRPSLDAVSCPTARECVAVGDDGVETTGILRAASRLPPLISVGRPTTTSGGASVLVSCHASASMPTPCRLSVTLTGVELVRGGRVTGVIAGRGASASARTSRRVVVFTHKVTEVFSGEPKRLHLPFEQAGRVLLFRLGHFKLRLVITAESAGSSGVTISHTVLFRE
jgi:hypothetical protein